MFARSWCQMHYWRWLRYGDTAIVNPLPTGPNSASWKKVPGYVAVHIRIRSAKGVASVHACQHCGMGAEQWAYDNAGGPDELVDEQGRRYCTDLDRYLPLCVTCHTAFDSEYRKKSA